MNRQEIITALEERGFSAEPIDVMKNNVMLHGIRFIEKNLAPVIYTDEIIAKAEETGATLEQIVAGIIDAYESRKSVNIDPDLITSADYLREHVKIGLQRATDEDIVKKPCEIGEDIEAYLYACISMSADGVASFKIAPGLLKTAGIDTAEAWEIAEKNTFSDTTIENMFSFMESLGMPAGGMGMPPIYIVSNKDHVKGAAAILDRETLRKFGKDHGTDKIIVIPSSVHECLIIPSAGEYDIDEITDIVKMVNTSTVDPVEQLGDRAFIVNL